MVDSIMERNCEKIGNVAYDASGARASPTNADTVTIREAPDIIIAWHRAKPKILGDNATVLLKLTPLT